MLRKKSVGGLLPVLMGLALIAAPLILTGCPGGSDPVRVTGVAIYQEVADADNLPVTGETITLFLGDDPVQLREVVTPANANNRAVDWTSANDAIATISAEGLVTAVAVGSSVITVTSRDVTTVSAQVTVVVADAAVDPNDPAIVEARNALQALITTANTRGPATAYTTATWGPFYDARNAAIDAAANMALTAAQLDAARTTLYNAMNALEEVALVNARRALDEAIEEAEELDLEDFADYDGTLDAFEEALAAAILVYGNAAATVAQLDAARDALEAAMAALVTVALYDARAALQTVVTAAFARQQANYIPDTWGPFYIYRTLAQTALTNWRTLDPEDLDEAREDLEEAMAALLTPRQVAINALDAAIAQAYEIFTGGIGGLDTALWNTFLAARTAAIAARALSATAEIAYLEAARNALVDAIVVLLGQGEATVTITFVDLTRPDIRVTDLSSLAVGDTITVENPGGLTNIRWYEGANPVMAPGGVLTVIPRWTGTTQLLTVRATMAGITYSLTVRFEVE